MESVGMQRGTRLRSRASALKGHLASTILNIKIQMYVCVKQLNSADGQFLYITFECHVQTLMQSRRSEIPSFLHLAILSL